jgi:drug/metabolite transporter (DMT)-like permease
MAHMNRRGTVFFIANSIIWGIPFWLSKVMLTQLTPETVVFLRSSIGGFFLILLAIKMGTLRIALRSWKWITAFSVIQMIIPWWLTTHAQRDLASSVVGLLMTLIPLFSLGIGYLQGEESVFSKRRILGICLGLLGVLFLIGIDLKSGHISLPAVSLVVVSTLGYALAPRIVKKHLKDVPSTGAVAVTLLISSLIWLVPGVLTWPTEEIRPTVIWATLTISLLCTAVAFWIFFELIKEVGPSKTSFLAFTNPMIAVLVGVFVAQEPLTIGLATGFPLILVGTYLAITQTTFSARVDNTQYPRGNHGSGTTREV